MNLDDINKQMFALQNDFQQMKNISPQNLPQSSLENINSINFQEINSPIETTQIKRPTKSGDHRNDINDKLNSMNTISILPKEISQNPPNTMPEFTRNYSSLQNNQIPQNIYQPPNAPQLQRKNMQNNQMQNNQMQNNQMQNNQMQNNHQVNQFANYYNHNFDTLQKNNQQKQQIPQMQQISSNQDINSYMSESNSNMFLDTHTGGLPVINPRNMYLNGNYEEIPNKYNESGYNKVEEKKIDYRQNMNNKLDNFIFNNPNAIEPNPILMQQNYNKYGQTKDTRMIIQDSNKDFYRQSANDRMSQYSPLSRASNMPISIASMTVNDFYSNLNGNDNQPNVLETSNKDLMNARIDKYAPLAKNIEYQPQNMQQNMQQDPKTKFNTIENINGKLNNVIFNNLPVMSNTVQNPMQNPIKK